MKWWGIIEKIFKETPALLSILDDGKLSRPMIEWISVNRYIHLAYSSSPYRLSEVSWDRQAELFQWNTFYDRILIIVEDECIIIIVHTVPCDYTPAASCRVISRCYFEWTVKLELIALSISSDNIQRPIELCAMPYESHMPTSCNTESTTFRWLDYTGCGRFFANGSNLWNSSAQRPAPQVNLEVCRQTTVNPLSQLSVILSLIGKEHWKQT